MFFLSKFLPLFVLPVGLFFVFLILGWFEWRRRFRKRVSRFWIIGMLQLYLFSTPWVAGQLIMSWEVPSPNVQELELIDDNIDYAVVLGGMTEYTGYEFEPFQLLDAADRLMVGMKLVNQGYAETLILSGGNNPLIDNEAPSEALLMKDWIRTYTNFDTTAIRIEPASVNTYENALGVKKVLEREGKGDRVFLITSAYHMRRARMIFEGVGLKPFPVATDHRSAKELDDSGILNWIPNSAALHYSSEILRELVGYAYYKLML